MPNYAGALVLTPFLWGIYAGVLLWQGKMKGLNHSIALQVLQVPMFGNLYISYNMYLGFQLLVGWFDGPVIHFWFGANSSYGLMVEQEVY